MIILQKFILICGFLSVSFVAQAQDTLPPVAGLQVQKQKFQPVIGADVIPDVKRHQKSNPEKVIFAHYKMSKVEPDIGMFAKLSPRVERAQDIDKSAMTISEYNRMNNRFNLLNPKDKIVIHTTLELDEYSSLQDLIVFDELTDKTYFKYPVYNENIGIVIKDIEKFGRIKISKPAAEKMFKEAGGSRDVDAEFVVVPEFADRKTPFTHNDTDYWLMMARVVEVRLWSDIDEGEEKLAWYYRDSNYKPADNQNLGGLYSKE